MKQWFIIHVYSGQEHKIAQILKEKLFQEHSDKLGEVIVPARTTSRLGKKGRVEIERKLYPGYVAIEMEPDKELFKLIAGAQGVLSFGKRGKEPQPISEEEREKMFGYIRPEAGNVPEVLFTKGDSVRIMDGPFADFTGTVEEISPEKERIKLMVTVFGRPTPVEVSFFQVEEI
jgi:transcriptional antiterminator NusG